MALSLECDALGLITQGADHLYRSGVIVALDLGPSFDVSFFAVGSYYAKVDVERLGAQRCAQPSSTDRLLIVGMGRRNNQFLARREVRLDPKDRVHLIGPGHGVVHDVVLHTRHVSDSLGLDQLALALAKP